MTTVRPVDRPASKMHSVEAAAAIIGVSHTTLYDLIRKAERGDERAAEQLADLRPRKLGRQWRISQANVDRYLGVIAAGEPTRAVS
jgi:transposase